MEVNVLTEPLEEKSSSYLICVGSLLMNLKMLFVRSFIYCSSKRIRMLLSFTCALVLWHFYMIWTAFGFCLMLEKRFHLQYLYMYSVMYVRLDKVVRNATVVIILSYHKQFIDCTCREWTNVFEMLVMTLESRIAWSS